ncbi:MAG: hypothetical protein CMJ70_03225 [Planctomycetaceae bacterium]|nr:hypothetical protein [Planctomycetaceae bacterium]
MACPGFSWQAGHIRLFSLCFSDWIARDLSDFSWVRLLRWALDNRFTGKRAEKEGQSTCMARFDTLN